LLHKAHKELYQGIPLVLIFNGLHSGAEVFEFDVAFLVWVHLPVHIFELIHQEHIQVHLVVGGGSGILDNLHVTLFLERLERFLIREGVEEVLRLQLAQNYLSLVLLFIHGRETRRLQGVFS